MCFFRFVLFSFFILYLNCAFSQENKFITLQEEITALEIKFRDNPSNFELVKDLVEKYNTNSSNIKAEKTIRDFQEKYLKKQPEKLAEVYRLFANTYKYQNDYEKAQIYFLKARDAFFKLKDFNGLVNCGADIIEFNRRQGKYDIAEKSYYYYCFTATKNKINSPKIWNRLYNRFAAVLNETNRGELSILFSEKAIFEAEKTKDFNAKATSYNEIGFSYKNFLDIKESSEYYLKAEEIWMKLGYFRDAVQAKMNRIIVLSHNELLSPKDRIKKSFEVIALIDKYNIDYSKKDAYDIIRSTYVNNLKDYKNAFIYEQKLSEERFNEIDKNNQSEVINIQEKYDNENLQQQNKSFSEKAKLKQIELQNARTRILLVASLLIVVLLALIALVIFWLRLRKANKLLIKRNQQKTILVQEIHHRVKNNLQFVRSMLDMQIVADESKQSEKSLNDVSRRIDAMSLVHEMLFIEEEKMGVSIKSYLERLIGFSNTVFSKDVKIKFELVVENIEMPVEKIVAIGIICSELITNSVKHAFKDHEAPILKISLTKKNEIFQLKVSDNGNEINELKEDKLYNLGMRLIDIFSRQLNGTYEISMEKGYSYTLEFKI